MSPLEVFFVVIGAMVALIGLARGYKRELGSTLVILVGIFVLTFLEDRIVNVFRLVGERLFAVVGDQQQLGDLFVMLAFELVFVMIVFAGYAGRTLDFAGFPAPPPQGTLMSLAVGVLNGYLVAGTLWFYLDKFSYPVQSFGWVVLPLTVTGQSIVEFLPQRLFESPSYWMLPVAVLVILRVRG